MNELFELVFSHRTHELNHSLPTNTHYLRLCIIGGNMTLRDKLLAFEVIAPCVTRASSVWYSCVWFARYSASTVCFQRELYSLAWRSWLACRELVFSTRLSW